ncbi:hypothetical protein GCM10022254_68460 [Actinomadura meridiana]|uniref:YbaB/EbfC DNA-binding family protein n=1 Tax=Actinomadura meridiana TaxID=559626 RepID=A0ABP8CM71_9ACTN
MADAKNRLNDILNQDVPHAPTSAEELRERLVNSRQAAAVPPGERPVSSTDEKVSDSLAEVTPSQEDGPVTVAAGRMSPPFTDSVDGDVLGGFEEVLAELGELSTGLAGAVDDSLEATGTDGTGTIEVTVAGKGRVTGFRLRRQWRVALTAETFDAAVMEAISDAVMSRMTLSLDNADGSAPGSGAQPSGSALSSSSWEPPRGMDPASALRQVNDLLDESNKRLEAFEEALTRPTENTEIKSENRRVTLAVQGGMVTGVLTQRSWLAKADQSRLCEEFSTAFEAVNDLVGSESREQAVPAGAAGAEVESVINELRDLLRGLGFPQGEETT